MRLTRIQWVAVALLVVASAGLSSIVTRAAGVPTGINDDPSTPVMVYSGVLLRDGVPVTTVTEIEVALWDDPLPGDQGSRLDKLLCETPENATITPDASGAFFIAMPDLAGVQPEKDCRAAITGRRNVWLQVKIAGTKVKFTDAAGQQTLERIALANVPFAIESGRASAAALPSQLENRLANLENKVFSVADGGVVPDPGVEIQQIADAGQ